MAQGRQKAEWARTSLLAAIGANPYRDTKKRKKPYSPNDFNPFGDDKPVAKKPKMKISVLCLKGLCRKEGLEIGN